MTKFNPNMSDMLYNNNSIPKNTNFFIKDYDNNRCIKFTPPKNDYVGSIDVLDYKYE